MPKEFSRIQRIAELIQRELSKILLFELEDPRVKLITITAVQLARDLSFAKVYISQFNSENQIEETLKILNKASAHIRYLLAHAIKLRVIPQLKFVYDVSIAQGAQISSLIDEVIAEDERKHRE